MVFSWKHQGTIGLWLVAPFSGDFWVPLASLPGALLLISGTVDLGRQLGLALLLRNAVAASEIATGVFTRQIVTSENDIAAAGLFITGIACGIALSNLVRARTDHRGVIVGSAGGSQVLCGLGYTGVAWLGLCGILSGSPGSKGVCTYRERLRDCGGLFGRLLVSAKLLVCGQPRLPAWHSQAGRRI